MSAGIVTYHHSNGEEDASLFNFVQLVLALEGVQWNQQLFVSICRWSRLLTRTWARLFLLLAFLAYRSVRRGMQLCAVDDRTSAPVDELFF